MVITARDDRTNKGQTRQTELQEIDRILTWLNTTDEETTLFEVISPVIEIDSDADVEEREEDDQTSKEITIARTESNSIKPPRPI